MPSRRPITADDLLSFRFVSDPRISPDGSRVAYAVKTIHDGKKYRSHIGMDDRPFTTGTGMDTQPRWAPDGRTLAFVRTADDESQVWLLPVSGGEARQMSRMPAGSIHGLEWSPNGRALVFTFRPRDLAAMDTDEAPGHSEAGTGSVSSAGGADGAPAAGSGKSWHREVPLFRHITRLRYKEEGVGFLDGRHDHIWIMDVPDGAARRITTGDQDDVSPAWSPDSRFIVFVSNRHRDADYRILENDLWIVPAAGGRARRLPTPAGPVSAPRFSPDGRTVAYVGHDRPDASWGTANMQVWSVPANGRGEAQRLTRRFDFSCEDLVITDTKGFHGTGQPPVWSADGRTIYFIASGLGACHLYSVSAKGGRPKPLTQGRFEVMNFSISRGAGGAAIGRGGRRGSARSARRGPLPAAIAMTISDALMPGEVFCFDPAATAAGGRRKRGLARGRASRTKPLALGDLTRVSRLNDDLLSGIELVRPRSFNFRSFDGTPIQGWLLRPRGFTPRKKWPLVLQIHGGPRALYGEAFFHEFQLFAARGYAVLYANPRGSQGYGEDFASAIVNDWGNLDYRDLMAAVDKAENQPWVDRKRLGVCGGSYGGYMTNWIVGHTTRFRSAITMRCVSNIFSFYGTSDFGYEDYSEFGGHAFDAPENYARQSPITFIKKVRTPLLIIHSEGDLRCAIEQAEQMYTMLKARRRKVEFIRFPEENHDLSRTGRPDRRVARLEKILDWWQRTL